MKKAPSYLYARKLMGHLQGDTDLAPLVMPGLFDRVSQCDLLLMTANSQYCCVAVNTGRSDQHGPGAAHAHHTDGLPDGSRHLHAAGIPVAARV